MFKRNVLLGLLLLAACDSDSKVETKPFYDGKGSLFLLAVRVFSDDGTMGYVLPSTALEGELSLSDALERPGGGMVYSDPGTGIVLIGDAESMGLTRFDVSAGRFDEKKTVSFLNLGVEDLWGGVVFVNEHQAYLLDRNEPRAFRFDPTTMELGAVLSFEGLDREGYHPAGYGLPIVRDDGIYMPMRWASSADDELPRSPRGSALIHIDPETDEVTVTSDSRCTSLLVSQTTASGDTWWYSDYNNVYARAVFGDEHAPPDCAMKLAKGETTFAEDGYIDLNERTGGPTMGFAAAGGSEMWLRVLDLEQFTPDPNDWGTIDVTPSWTWFKLDVASDAPAVPEPGSEHDTIGVPASYTVDRTFVTFPSSDYAESRLVEITKDGLQERATVRGLLDMVTQAF